MSVYKTIRYESAGVEVYATLDDLPLSGVEEGSQALVDSTDRLYIWSDTGWYNIALINTTPSISGAASTYDLPNDGSAVTITISSTDPEGLPITYSIASDTSANTATVVQGTGANTNIFTVTPSTNSADAGSFSLTFRASDGINIASAVSTFTLNFITSIADSKYTTALVTSVGANLADNNDFVDSSTNSHTITPNGNVTQNAFSPYRHGGYSTYFDGSGDNLTTAGAILSTSGAFTVQCWVYLDDTSNATLWAQGTGGNSQRASVTIEAGNWYAQIGSAVINTTAAVANVWKFIEFQYDGSQIELFVDGTSVGTASTTTNAQNTGLFIGKLWAGGYDLQGYITDFRVINGTPSGSSTSPTERLTAVTNTELLTCHLPYIADDSTNSHAITVNGNTKTLPFAPYDHDEYDEADHGGSMYFDGDGDGLSAPAHTSFDIGSGDFTIETWFYSSNPDTSYLFGKGDGSSASGTSFWVSGGSGAGLFLFHGGSYTIMQTGALPVNQWTHLAFVRNGTNFSTYINGKSVHSTTASITVNTTTNVLQIADYPPTPNWVGFQSDFRFVKGTAVYTSAFTPPTAPLTAITNTSLLLNGTDAGIIDKSQSQKTITLSGDVKSSTTQSKYLSSSMYFDGTGDYLSIADDPSLRLGAGEFTIEFWMYMTSLARTVFADKYDGTSAGWQIQYRDYNNVNHIAFSTNAGHYATTPSDEIQTNTWYHVAAVRDSSNNLKIYINGVEKGSSTSYTQDLNGTAAVNVGVQTYNIAAGYMNGYISDFRITKGLARYTANFTAPTAALQG